MWCGEEIKLSKKSGENTAFLKSRHFKQELLYQTKQKIFIQEERHHSQQQTFWKSHYNILLQNNNKIIHFTQLKKDQIWRIARDLDE